MKKIIPLSLIAVASLYASEVQLSPIDVESTIITDVSSKAQKSADIAEALSVAVPSIDMSRRSGIANDILLRGQKRDNIAIEVDGTKVCGACPNRMDPPVSHVLANQIEEIEVIEGPYDVETFGVMSGAVKIKTKAPTQKLHGEVNFGYGSWNYMKVGATASGGNDIVKVLVSASSESSDQYQDGDGNTMSQQTKKHAASVPGTPATSPAKKMAVGMQYTPANEDIKAYQKRSIMTKAFVTITEDQELRLSYTNNKSDGVLYPNTPMDAVYDYSEIYSVAYNINNISDIYKNVNLEYYYSKVDHPMDNANRKSSGGPAGIITHHLDTSMEGLKLKNVFDIQNYELLVGLDGSERTWDGAYFTSKPNPMNGRISIDDVSTENTAIFAKLDKTFGSLNFSVGARYDYTKIDPARSLNSKHQKSNKYDALNANIFTSYNLDKENSLFLGVGQASRVPDARELYLVGKNNVEVGTETLKQATNTEIDLGYELQADIFSLKIKGFYSMYDDYIYYEKNLAEHNFVNLDATIYGGELTGTAYATDTIWFDIGASYKKGTKDEVATVGESKNMADIAPLRGNLAGTWEYMNDSTLMAVVRSSDKWSDFDRTNGEQALSAWTVFDMKLKHAFNKNFDFTLGVNNLFDKTYAQSNTYADLTLITGGTGEIMLMNEPGRYVYTNLDFKF